MASQQVDQIFQKFECRDQSGKGVVRNIVRWSIPRLLEVLLFFYVSSLLGEGFYYDIYKCYTLSYAYLQEITSERLWKIFFFGCLYAEVSINPVIKALKLLSYVGSKPFKMLKKCHDCPLALCAEIIHLLLLIIVL